MKTKLAGMMFTALACANCLGVAEERASRDLEVGSATSEGLSVQVQEGLASVRGISARKLHLWAQAPELRIDLAVPAGWDQMEVQVDNCLGDAELGLLRPDPNVVITPIPTQVPTERRWVLSGLTTGGLSVVLMPPDAMLTTPWRFGVFADVQERVGSVQDIYKRMNQEPDMRFVIMSGDLTRRGTPAELRRFQSEMKPLRMPIYATLGNHELGTRDDLFHEYFGRGNFSFRFRGVHFTLLDSASATLAPKVYDWLTAWLQQGQSSVHFVFMHIPPLDPVGTRNGAFASRLEASKLLSLLAAGNVDTTVYGHVHSYYAYSNAGIPAYITGGGGAIPERFDGIGRHFLTIDVDPNTQVSRVGLVRVD